MRGMYSYVLRTYVLNTSAVPADLSWKTPVLVGRSPVFLLVNHLFRVLDFRQKRIYIMVINNTLAIGDVTYVEPYMSLASGGSRPETSLYLLGVSVASGPSQPYSADDIRQ